MMPNIDPRTLKSMMDRMGIKSSEIAADSVVISCADKRILIKNPQVTRIEAQGVVSFQISGDISETEPEQQKVEITDDDIDTVMRQSGISDRSAAERALEESNGDIAEAIINLKNEKE